MTIKEFAYTAQHHLQASTGTQFKRAHIYELLAAAFGFNSYAALSADAVFTKQSMSNRRAADFCHRLRDRCLVIGYQGETASNVATLLPALMTEQRIGLVTIDSLITCLQNETAIGYGARCDLVNQDEVRWWTSSDELVSPIMLDGLNAAASNGHGAAHYALALLHAPTYEERYSPEIGSDYGYLQAKAGHVVAGAEPAYADAHADRLVRDEKFALHLREAARLGYQNALLVLADRFGDPAFFDQTTAEVNADLSWIAKIAEDMNRPEDAKKWLTKAAKKGNINAMLKLIDGYDSEDLQQCWIWVYLAKLLGTDLTEDAYVAIHEDGSRYDDDIGGPLYVDGREGLHLRPIGEERSASARLIARELFEKIHLSPN